LCDEIADETVREDRLAHQPSDTLVSDAVSSGVQLSVNARAAIPLPARLERRAHVRL